MKDFEFLGFEVWRFYILRNFFGSLGLKCGGVLGVNDLSRLPYPLRSQLGVQGIEFRVYFNFRLITTFCFFETLGEVSHGFHMNYF